MTAASELIGQRFGRLVVIERTESKYGKAHWICICDCGNTTGPVATGTLKSGHSKSCGCIQKEHAVKHGKSKAIHRMGDTKIYRVWQAMKQRCNYPKTKYYKNYGGRGIKVCEEWESDFTTFYEWAMANGYEDGLSIDRKDVNGNYEPSNCKWSTNLEQQNNTRYNVMLTYKGETKTASQWARLLNVKRAKIYRLASKNLSGDEIFSILLSQ